MPNANAVYIYKVGRSLGVTKEGMCAILANVQAESVFDPTNLEDTANYKLGVSDATYTKQVDDGTYTRFVNDGYGYGLAQWTFWSRKQKFYNYAKSRGKSIGDLKLQTDFLFYEIKSDFNGIWQMLLTSHDLYACTKELLYKWENPFEKTENMKLRYSYAQGWLHTIEDEDTEPSGDESVPDPVNPEPSLKFNIRMIDMNMEGPDVKLAQAALICWGYNILVTGIFGKEMDEKVRDFQKRSGLSVDGVIGPMTWKALLKVPDKL